VWTSPPRWRRDGTRSLVAVLLAFDTATPAVTVALHDGERVVASTTRVDARRHGELLAPGITAVLDEAWVPRQDITAVAVGVGPGPFTGLRVGLVTARTLALALQIPVYGVCTLDVLAVQAVDEGAVDGPFLVATDARRKEVYWAAYDGQGMRLEGPHVSRPADVASAAAVVGSGALLHPDSFPRAVGPEHPDAGVLAGVVTDERAELLDPEPLYLRRPDAATPGKPKPVS
jgi:tRNA threonylcarbamoyladenosine biosynthesis protein TsaB